MKQYTDTQILNYILENNMQISSAYMDGNHSWCFTNCGTSYKGKSKKQAIINEMNKFYGN